MRRGNWGLNIYMIRYKITSLKIFWKRFKQNLAETFVKAQIVKLAHDSLETSGVSKGRGLNWNKEQSKTTKGV